MKDFKKFLEEVSIVGNTGIPGDRPGENPYLSDVTARAKTKFGIRGNESPREIGEFARPLMSLVGKSKEYIKGNEEAIENLVTNVIRANFGDILDDDILLDIKIIKDGLEIKDFLEEEDDDKKPPTFENVTDPDLIKRIEKAKIANNIIQGEAKNTKHILHSDEIKDGLKDIYGDKSEIIFKIWDDISKIADKLDWMIPIDIKSDMMQVAPEGLAGAVKVDWKPKEIKEEEEEEESDYDEDNQREEEEITYQPIIRARGIDLPMLIHETVKGIYELIASISLPGEFASEEELKSAETIKLNVGSFLDEAEDFRNGPEIAADFRDFINSNPNSKYKNNIRALVFGKMMDEAYMTPDEFLKLFRGVLNKTPEARKRIDEIIDEIIKEYKKYELGEVLGHDLNSEEEEEGPNYDTMGMKKPGSGLDYEAMGMDRPEDDDEEEEEEEIDYTRLSQKEIVDLIDIALEDGDFKEVEKISKYLKEGREIYLRESKMMSDRLHNKRI